MDGLHKMLEAGQAKLLVTIIRDKFLNIHNIISRLSQEEGGRFLARNEHYRDAHRSKHGSCRGTPGS